MVNALTNQYETAGLPIAGFVKQNISSLAEDNTFTITTGQQIHIGLGPLYVIYKALDVLAIAKEFREKYPEKNFVPVFWMASEDHDLEEISEVNVFGKKLKWETDQVGPVGRMKPNGLYELFQTIKDDFNFSDLQFAFIQKCQDIYSSSANLSIAFRRLMHEYFGSTGLVILDGDNQELKDSFSTVLDDELKTKNYESLEASSKLFEESGYKRQLVIRPSNLFDMTSGNRVKVSERTNVSVAHNAYNLSPNAALRPFYQEWILPNLLYVGGPSELKYWMQLKGIFDNYKLPMPILHLRTSNIIVPKKQFEKSGLNEVDILFESNVNLAKKMSEETKSLAIDLQAKHETILKSIQDYKVLTAKSFKGFSLEGKINKLVPKVEELRSLTDIQLQLHISGNSDLNKVLKIKDKYFNSEKVQEREEHVLAHVYLLHVGLSELISHFGLKNSQKIGLLFT